MDLAEWIKSKGYTISAVARRLGVSRPSLHAIMLGTSSPRLDTAYKIILFTRNEVSIEDLLMASKRARTITPERTTSPMGEKLEIPKELLEWESRYGA